MLEPLFSGLSPATLLEKRFLQRREFCEFCKIFKNTFFTEHFGVTYFCNSSYSFILQRSFIYSFKPSFVRKIDKNSQFCHLFCLQIHFILFNVNVFYRSKHKHKKPCFVNEIVDLHFYKV